MTSVHGEPGRTKGLHLEHVPFSVPPKQSRHRKRKVFIFLRGVEDKSSYFLFSCLSISVMPRLRRDLKEGSQKQASFQCRLNGRCRVNIDSFN